MTSTQMSKNATMRWVLVLTGIGSLMAALDTLVVSTALSTIRLVEGRSSLRSWLYRIATNAWPQHKSVDERLPEQSQQATLRSLGDVALRDVVERYVDAWERGDVEAVVAMLAENATIAMPPMPTWYRGRDAVAAFLRGWPLAGERRWRLVPAQANGQLAVAHYIWDGEKESFIAHSINVLGLHGARIQEITAFLEPETFVRFGLADEIPTSLR